VAGYPHTLFARTGHPTDDPQPKRVGRWECAERALGEFRRPARSSATTCAAFGSISEALPVLVAATAPRFTRCVDRAAPKRPVRGTTMQEGKSAAYTTGSR
jgi:hypothetical protein